MEGNGWLSPCSGLLGGCDHPIAFNYNPEAIAPSTCLYEGPCGAWTTLDGETVGLTGGLSFDNWTVSGTADGEVFANETYLMLATDGDATAGAEIAASFEMPVSGTLQFSWAQLLTHEPTTFDEEWTPDYSINGGPKVYLEPFYDFRTGSLSGSPTTPDFNFDAWATEDPDFFSLGTFAPGDSLVLPPLNQLATVDNPWAYAAVPFHEVVTLELQAEDQIHFALQPHPTTAAAEAIFAGWLSPAGVCNDISGCTYPQACNYNPEASQEDGSCTFAEPLFDCDGNPLVAENLCPRGRGQ